MPASRWEHPSRRLRLLLQHEPFVFAPGVYDPYTAQMAMYYGFAAVYFSGYSFAMGHVGSTDMDLYSSVEIAGAARRTVSALREFQLTMGVGDPDAGVPPTHLHSPPLLVDTEEMLGKLRAIRDTADDLGNPEFVIAARTDAYSAVDAPEARRGMDLAVERGLRYLGTGVPDLLWCELPTSAREPVETFATKIRKRFPAAKLAFNWSSSFKWHLDPDPLQCDELGQMGYHLIFITLAAIHANGLGFARLLQGLRDQGAEGYVSLQCQEWADGLNLDLPTRSHHLFSGVPYHHRLGSQYGAARLSREVHEELREAATV